jgi:hypothetical protein
MPCNRKTPLHPLISATGNKINKITYHKLVFVDSTVVKCNIQFVFGTALVASKIVVEHGDDVV